MAKRDFDAAMDRLKAPAPALVAVADPAPDAEPAALRLGDRVLVGVGGRETAVGMISGLGDPLDVVVFRAGHAPWNTRLAVAERSLGGSPLQQGQWRERD